MNTPWHRQVPDGIDHALTDELNRRARWQRRRDALLECSPLLPLVAVLLLLIGFGLGLLSAGWIVDRRAVDSAASIHPPLPLHPPAP